MSHTILLIDDELMVLQALVRGMRKEPLQFRTATSAEEALRILARDRVDVIVCDWGMPGMSGTEFLTKVAQLYPATIRIMLTGQPTLEVAMGALNNGRVHRFLTKPIDADALAATIRETLEQRVPVLSPGA